jgi:hypothetical protein
MQQQLLIKQHEHRRVIHRFSSKYFLLIIFYLAVADTYIKLSSALNTLSTSDKSDLNR